MKHRLFVTSALLAAVVAFSVGSAEAYPDKPVRLIIPFGVGGNNDIVGRKIAEGLSERLGQQVFADNRGGSGGVIGTEMAAHAEPDGYTLLLVSSAFPISASLYKLPYDQETAFDPVAKLLDSTSALIVGKSVPANTVEELIALMKEKPGELIATATGVGGLGHLSAELFKEKAGVDFKIVFFKGGGEMIADMLGGHSQLFFTSLVQALPNLKAGESKILGTAGSKRSSLMPDVPTISEAGVPGYQVANWWGVSVPAGTPAEIIDQLSAALKDLVASEDFVKWAQDQGLEVDFLGPADFDQYIDAETAKWHETVEAADIEVQQ